MGVIFFLPGADFEIKMDCAMALALRFSVAEANRGRYVRGGREACDCIRADVI